MPFNKELEDFAQAFSTGYGMVKSKEERESERLDLEHKRFVVERDPTLAAQQDALYDVDMQLRRGQITDAEAKRKQDAILYPIQVDTAKANLAGQQTQNKIGALNLEHLPTELEQRDAQAAATLTGTQTQNALGELELAHRPEQYKQQDAQAAASLKSTQTQTAISELDLAHRPIEFQQQAEEFTSRMEVLGLDIAAKKYAASRTPIDDAHRDALFQLEQQHAKNVITDDEWQQKRRAVDAAYEDAVRKYDLAVKAHEASPEVLAAKDKLVQTQTGAAQQQIEQGKASTAKTKAETVPLDYANSILEMVQRLRGGQAPGEPAGAVDQSLPGTGYGRIGGTPGPQSAVEVPQSTIGTHDDESGAAEEGITKGSKNSPTAATMRKLKNGEIPTMADYINVGVETSVNAAKSAADDAGIHKDEAVSTPGSELNFSNWLKGAHGADTDTAEMVIDTVKEVSGGSLTPQQEMLTAIATGQLAFSLAGMPEKAQAFAKGMQGYTQQLFGQYAAFAKAAAAEGDVDGTTMGLMKAYLNVGDGKELDIRPDPKHEGKYIAKVTDTRTGKTVEEHVVSPEEILGKAMMVTPGTSMELLNAAAGDKDETISDAAARVLAAEYKDYGLTAKEISDMTTAEFEKVQERLEKDITARKPKEYTLDERKEAASQIDGALEKFKGSNPDQFKALKLDDPASGTLEDLIPAASQILLWNDHLQPERAFRAAINLVANGPSEPVVELTNGRLLVSVAGVSPFVMDANEYSILTANRRKYGVPTDSGLPADEQRYNVGEAGPAGPAVSPTPAAPAAPTEDWKKMREEMRTPFWAKPGFFQQHPAARPR